MAKKVISCLLTVFMLVSLLPALPVVVYAAEEPGGEPELISASAIAWQGIYPAAGDSNFYVQAKGRNLEGLEAVVCTYDYGAVPEYTPVANQVEKRLLGKTIEGYDWYIYKMATDQGQTLADGQNYYVRLWDGENTYYESGNSFYVDAQPYYAPLSVEVPAEISSATTAVPLSIRAFGFAPELSAADFQVELVDADGMGWGSGLEQEVPGSTPLSVGQMAEPEAAPVEDGGYLLTGSVALNNALAAGQTLYARVTGPSAHPTTENPARSKYSMVPIYVLDGSTAAIGQFNVYNSLVCRSAQGEFEGGHTGYPGGGYLRADSETTFAVSETEDKLYFELTGTNLAETAKLSATLDEAPVSLSGVTVRAMPYGIYTVTGEVNLAPPSAGQLKFLYDGVSFHETAVSRVAAAAAQGVTDFTFEGGNFSGELPPVPAGGSLSINLGYPLNLVTGQRYFTAALQKTSSGAAVGDIVYLDVAEQPERGQLILELTTGEALSGDYELALFYQGEPVSQCAYGYDWDSDAWGIESWELQPWFISFGTGSAGSEENGLVAIENDDGGLILKGGGYSPSASYTAHFISRGGSSLTPAEAEVSANYQSATSLIISADNLAALPLGWYTVYLTAGGELVNGLADTALLPQSDALRRPTAGITSGDYTLDQNVDLKITFGDYIRVKIAESISGLEGAAWQDTPPTSYTLSEGYGEKTLYFLFEAADGSTVTLSDSITYRSEFLAGFSAYGVAGAAETELRLSKGLSYIFYFKHAEPNLTGTVEFQTESGDLLRPETLRRTSGSDGVYTYSKSVKIDDSLAGTKQLVFSARDGNNFSTPEEKLSVVVLNRAAISRKGTSFNITWAGNQRHLVAESEVSYSLSGTPSFTAQATLTYQDSTGSEVTQEYPLTESESKPGVYGVKVNLPEAAVKVLGVEYKLTDPQNPSINSTSEIETYTLPVAAVASFSGLANSDGKYNGLYFTVSSEMPWDYKAQIISGNQTSFNFTDLLPGVAYTYAIFDNNLTYASGSLTPTAGQANNVSFSSIDVKEPAGLTFAVYGGELDPNAYVHYTFLRDGNSWNGYLRPGQEQTGFYAGQELAYTLNLSYDDATKFQVPGTKSLTIGQGSHTETINLEPLPIVTVSGTVRDERIQDRVIEGVSVSASQLISNGPTSFWHSASAVTDAEGRFELSLYKDFPAQVSFYRQGYQSSSQEDFNPGEKGAALNVSLAYATTNRVRVTLLVEPLAAEGEAAGEAVVADARQIYLRQAEGITGSAIYSQYWSAVTLSGDATENAGKTISLSFGSSTLDLPASTSAVLDAYANGSVEVLARQRGVIKATVPASGANPPPAYLLVFNQDGTRQGDVIAGSERLSTEKLYLPEGSYTLIFLRGDDLNRLANFGTLAEFEALGLPQGSYYIQKTAAVKSGVLTDLGEIEIPQVVDNDQLGVFEVRFDAEYIPNAQGGEAKVIARVRPSDVPWERSISLKSLSWRSSSYDYDLKPGGSFVDSQGVQGSGSYFAGEEQKTTERTLQFAILPREEQQVITPQVYVDYTLNGQSFRETFRQEIRVTRVTMEVLQQVEQGEKARFLAINGSAPADATVNVYDGEQLIGTAVAGRNNRYELRASLTSPDDPGLRFLTAKIEQDGETFTSEEQVVEVVSKTMSAYASDIEFLHYPHGNYGAFPLTTQFYLDDPANPNFSANRFYNPSRESTVTFRINNLLKDQIESAALIKSYRGSEYSYEAEWLEDVENDQEIYSKWQVTAVLGYMDDLYVEYSLAKLDDLDLFTGFQLPDFEEAITAEADPADIPPAIRDAANVVVENGDPNLLSGSMDLAGGGSLSYNASFTENSGMTSALLEAQGYRRVDTVQGSYWVKETVSHSAGSLPGTVNSQMTRSMYFDENLTAILNPPTVGANQHRTLSIMAESAGTTDSALSAVEITGNLQNAGEVIYEGFKGAPANLGRFSSAMNVAGSVALAVNIFRGRTTKDAQTLYDALSLIKSSSVQSTLRREIQEYSSLTVSHYTISNVFNGVGYVSGYAGPIGKGLSLITSLGGGWYNSSTGSELNSMWDSIMRSILAELELQDLRAKKKEKQKKVKWHYDPSGYVFEAIDTNRVEDAEAGLYASATQEGPFEFWQEAAETNQINPQQTNAEGRYGWDVPQGWWKVQFAKDGYLPAETKAMEVEPMHDQVNIGLLATDSPAVIASALTAEGLEIEFDKFMQAESIYDEATGIMNVEVRDSAGNAVPLGPVEFMIAAENTGYAEDMTYQKDVLYSDTFVKRIRLTADETRYPGGFRSYQDDGETPETYEAVVKENVRSYAGVKMARDYTIAALTVAEREQASKPGADIPAGSYAVPQNVSLTTETEGATIYYTLDGSEPSALSRAYGSRPIAIEKTGTLKFFASKAGMDDSEVTTLSYVIGGEDQKVVAAPVADLPSGTYSSTQQVILRSLTPGAAIYYTTDGTVPSRNSARYTGPIGVSQSMTIKAIAVIDSYADSGVAAFSYIIKTSGGGSSARDELVPSPELEITVDRTGGKPVIKTAIASVTAAAKAKAGVSAETIQALLERAAKEGAAGSRIELAVETDQDVTQVELTVAAAYLAQAAEAEISFGFSSPLATVLLDRQALSSVAAVSPAGEAKITVAAVSPAALSAAEQAQVQGRPVYDLTVTAGEKPVADFDRGFATVRIPYELQAGENENAVVIYYLAADGSLKPVRGHYDPLTATVVFKTAHFSKFVIGYNPVTFSDVPASAWYKDAVDFIAARGITTGTTKDQFSPQDRLTRGQYLVMIMRAYGLEPDQAPQINFADAGDTYYTGYLAAARRLDITKGIGNNLFAPERPITRQEMFTLLYNTLQELGELPSGTGGKPLTSFSDAGQVASWAKEAMELLTQTGIVSGSGGLLNPTGTATRAEMAQVLYNLL